MTTPTNKAPRKARRKVTTDLGRQLLTRERQRLAREQASLAEQQLLEAERRRTQQKRNVQSVKPIDIAVSRSIVRRFAGVLASEGINVRITAQPAARTAAWTDFESISIFYEAQDDDRILAATLRGLAYHEGGHCRFTLPFAQLAEQAGVSNTEYGLHTAWNCLEDQRMETAVVSDSPRKAAYLTPMIMLNHTPNVNAAAANWPLLIWRKYLPVNIRKGARRMFVAKHTLSGIDGEALARDFEACVTKYVLADNAVTMWEAVVEYYSLLQRSKPLHSDMSDNAAGHNRQYRQASERTDMDDFLVIPVAGDMVNEGGEGESTDDQIDNDEMTDPQAWVRFEEALHALLNGGDVILVIYSPQGKPEEGEGNGGAGSLGDDEDDKESGSKGDDTDGDDDTEGEGDGSNDQGGDDEGLEYADESRGDDSSSQGGSAGEHKNTGIREGLDYKPAAGDDDDELTDDMLQEAIEEAEQVRDSDVSVDADVRALHEALNERTSDLMPYNAGISDDAEAKAAADNLAQDIQQAFQENTVDKAPGWVEGQRRGIVNVLRYETRRPGDVEFFRAYTETDAPGQNIAVSVLLDYSGSMNSNVKGLAQTGYACKVACQSLDIPCTVTLWDTNATVLWDATEIAESLPVVVSAGGTDPSIALADLDRQRYDKDIHIVIIMTDGSWSGSCANTGYLASYKGDGAGRYFIGLGYGSSSYDSGSSETMANNLRRYGCDEAHGIDNLMDIPHYLEQALIAFS